jgi:uncharacterized membrane protein
MPETKNLGKTGLGMQANLAATLCYLLGWVTGLIFYLIEKENKYVRFHAMQSMIVFGVLNILGMALIFIPIFGWMLIMVLWPLQIVLWVVLMVKAYQGEQIKLPIAGKIAEQNT